VSDPKKLDPRAVILARRARFVAAAMASIGIACGKQEQKPQPCLSPIVNPDAAGATPASDLPEASTDAGSEDATPAPADAGTDAEGGTPKTGTKAKPDAGGQRPQVCLRIAPPRPCLKMAKPDPDRSF